MRNLRPQNLHIIGAGLVLLFPFGALKAQSGAPGLPPTPPTTNIAPIAGTSSGQSGEGTRSHTPEVTCANGELSVHADGASLNQILRSIARCTGMRISGGVADQRVFGNYGPAAPATVLATLVDGTGSNMLFKAAAADGPAELILTPRTGGPTPPAPQASPTYNQEDDDNNAVAPPQAQRPMTRPMGRTGFSGSPQGTPPGGFGQTPVPQPYAGSPVTDPPAQAPPLNNVNGSPNNVSPTVGNYPTANSVPLDSVATPSTTPPTDGIVDSPNPPPAGSDTAAVLNGTPKGTLGNVTLTTGATSQTSTPGATNTTVPVSGQTPAAGQTSGDLTPQQVFQQLQQRMQQSQQQQTAPNSNSNSEDE